MHPRLPLSAMRFKTSKINVNEKCYSVNVRERFTLLYLLPIRVVTLYLSLFPFFVSLSYNCLLLFFLPCSLTTEYISTIENRSIDRSMHFSLLSTFSLCFLPPLLLSLCLFMAAHTVCLNIELFFCFFQFLTQPF